jgi:hypothetical protein
MDGTILSQGTFLASQQSTIVAIPSGVDWMRVINPSAYSLAGTASPSFGISFYWQRGFAPGYAIVEYYGTGTTAINGDTISSGGFTLYDPTGQTPGSMPIISNPVVTTATTNATTPVVSTASTAGLSVGSVVRMSNTAQTDVNGIDMVVSAVTANTSFELLFSDNALANAPGAIGGAGFYRIVNSMELFYPRHRYITNITNGTSPTVSTSVAHGMTPGQQIRFTIPTLSTGLSGMTQLDGMSATVTQVIDDYSFIINVDTSAFSPFVWPTISQQPSSFPIMVPFGEDTATSLVSPFSQIPEVNGIQIPGTQSGILADATVNTGILGMELGLGGVGFVLGTPISGPGTNIFGPSVTNTIYWVAGKSSYGGY